MTQDLGYYHFLNNREGIIDTDFITDNLDDSVMVISVIGVNNEIGTIQSLADIGGVEHSETVTSGTE